MSWRQKKCYRLYLCNIWHGNKLWRQPAENIQLVAKIKKGTSFFTFTMPTKDIFSEVLHVSKFNVSWVAGNKCLYRGGNILQTVPFHDVFDYLLISLQIQRVLVTKPFSMSTICIFWCTYTVKNNSRLHKRASSDIEGIKYPFADSLIPFGNLVKEKHMGLKQYDGSFVTIHQEVLYKHLFGTEFQGHHALEDVKAKSKFLFRSSLQLHLYLFPKLPIKVAQPTLTQPSQIWTLTDVTLFLSHLIE